VLAKLGRFLQSRFPEKLEVTKERYESLEHQVKAFADLLTRIELLEQRLSVVETAAVHKEPVQALIAHVQKLSDTVNALKFGLGMDRPVSAKDAEIQAVLNGIPLTGDNTNEQI
jgi:hypothetical protein